MPQTPNLAICNAFLWPIKIIIIIVSHFTNSIKTSRSRLITRFSEMTFENEKEYGYIELHGTYYHSYFSFTGCGRHIEEVLKGIPPEERCQCPRE